MAPQGETTEPILFLWSLSAWAAKITAYLALRRIPHARCEQPITQPRPDLAALGVQYRRIPVLALGRDVYCDTISILQALESQYPPSSAHPPISAATGTPHALEKLFEKWTDLCVFPPAAKVIPSELDLMKDPTFQRDREELWGRSWGKETQDALRPKGTADLRANFDLLEATLSDGREWISGSEGPLLVDIHACWIFNWLGLLDAYDARFISPTTYPLTFAWRDRYAAAIDAAQAAAPQPRELTGAEAADRILRGGAKFRDTRVEHDPEGFREGDEVEMWPVDTGFGSRDHGRLVGLDVREMVVQTQAPAESGGGEVRIHYPRWNFAMTRVSGEGVNGGGGEGKRDDGEFVTLN